MAKYEVQMSVTVMVPVTVDAVDEAEARRKAAGGPTQWTSQLVPATRQVSFWQARGEPRKVSEG